MGPTLLLEYESGPNRHLCTLHSASFKSISIRVGFLSVDHLIHYTIKRITNISDSEVNSNQMVGSY
jgi:hypothetical protein